MKIIKAGYEIITPIDGKIILERIEQIARVCYKSEPKAKEGSAEKMVANLIKNRHEAMIEHCSFTVKFIVDRGISHEIVRHRMASYAQESTRYCNYIKEDFGSEITVIEPCYLEKDTKAYNTWKSTCMTNEEAYFSMLNIGCTPEEARAVLPHSLKTEICVTMNLREWRHFFKLRAANMTGKAHPQMLEVTIPLLNELKGKIPVVFDDIKA